MKNIIKKILPDFSAEYAEMYPEYLEKVKAYRAKNSDRFGMAVKDVTIVVTENCNLRCSYCYQHDKNCEHILTKETAKRIVDLLFEEDAKENPYLNPDIAQAIILDFIGGEPLLEIEIINYFMKYFLWKAIQLNHRWAIHYMISISSNGTLYKNPEVQKFMTVYEGRVSLGITLDGNKELHDACRRYPNGSPSYDLVAESVLDCQKRFDQSKDTKLTIAPANVEYLADAIKNLYDNFNFQGVHANCIYEEGWTFKDATILYEQMKKITDWFIENKHYKTFYCSLFDNFIGHSLSEQDNQNWCGGTGCMLCFTTKGDVTPCLRYTRFNLNDKQPEIIIGDLENGIGNLNEHKTIMDNLDKITRRSQSTDECFNCPIASGCAWCSAYNYEVYGTPNKRATFICPMHKARVLANIYFWNKIYLIEQPELIFECHIPKDWALEIIDEKEYDMLIELTKR